MSSFLNNLQNLWQTDDVKAAIALRHEALLRGCWIYGAGGYGRRILAALRELKLECLGFIDRRAGDAKLQESLGLRLHHPDEFTRAMAENCSVIIGVMNTSASLVEPLAWAEQLGFDQIILPNSLPELLGGNLDTYWMTNRALTAEHLVEVEQVYDLLADETSKGIYQNIVEFRLTGDPRRHPPVHIEEQYAPSGVPLKLNEICLVDGGAFNGDTLRGLKKRGASIIDWLAFEPDLGNFRELVNTPMLDGTRSTFYPCGLGDKIIDLSFSDGEGAGSHLGSGESTAQNSVRVVSLDEVVHGVKPTYIKLDIEGYEAEALAGMKNTIDKHNPALAVCIYHKPDDLWRLPLLVHDLVPKSRLYIRQHGHAGFDTVLYACPD